MRTLRMSVGLSYPVLVYKTMKFLNLKSCNMCLYVPIDVVVTDRE